MQKKIITNYHILNEGEETKEQVFKSIDPIVKIPIYNNEVKQIEPMVIIEEEEEEEEIVLEPTLQLTRNTEGIVVGIEVQCTCGEKILIKMDYK